MARTVLTGRSAISGFGLALFLQSSWGYVHSKFFLVTSFSLAFSKLSLEGLALDLVDLVVWNCWLGHLICKIVPERTFNVLSAMLNPAVQYHTIMWLNELLKYIFAEYEWVRVNWQYEAFRNSLGFKNECFTLELLFMLWWWLCDESWHVVGEIIKQYKAIYRCASAAEILHWRYNNAGRDCSWSG